MKFVMILILAMLAVSSWADSNCMKLDPAQVFISDVNISQVLQTQKPILLADSGVQRISSSSDMQVGKVICCCNTYNGGSCCKEVSFCSGSYVPGCLCSN